MIRKPYLLFLGDAPDALAAKVARGINEWRPEQVLGQYRMDDCKADLGIKDMSVREAREAGAGTMVVGVANRGGVISERWKSVLREALEEGLDLASGLHRRLADDPELVRIAHANGREMHDVRQPIGSFLIGNGRKRSGKRCLAVGTDVSIGKMYASLALARELAKRGSKCTFKATGQTGILIEGEGIPLDAVVADFMSGAVEQLTPDNDDDHWDLIEGQGSLFHPSFSGISLALIHGGQPDALVLCHEPTRTSMRGLSGYGLPTLEKLRDMALDLAHVVNPGCSVIGISINSSNMGEDEALSYAEKVEAKMGLPVQDPVRHGVDRLADNLLSL